MSRAGLFARFSAAVALIIATAFALHRWTILPMRCALAASRGGRELRAAERKDASRRQRAVIEVRASLAECDCSPTHELYFTRAQASALIHDTRGAIADFGRALEIERRPETYFARGMASLDALQQDLAMQDLERACAFDPSRLDDIPYEAIRRETQRRIRAAYGDDWIP